MKQQRILWPLLGLMTGLTLSVPAIGLTQNHETSERAGLTRIQDNLRMASNTGIELRDRMVGTKAPTASTPEAADMDRRAQATSVRHGSFPATESEAKGATKAEEPALTGSGEMDEADRTGTSGPSGTRSTSPLNTGAIDTMGRVTKSAGDEAVTENDRALVAQARVALAGNPVINNNTESDVHLKADNGIIYLSGSAANQQTQMAMVETVKGITGVRGVVNQLQIRPGTVGAVK